MGYVPLTVNSYGFLLAASEITLLGNKLHGVDQTPTNEAFPARKEKFSFRTRTPQINPRSANDRMLPLPITK